MLKSLSNQEKQVTCYEEGVCYINAPFYRELRHTIPGVKLYVTIKQNEEGEIVLFPIKDKKEEPDARKVSPRGGGGSFSHRDLVRAVCLSPDPKKIAFEGKDPYTSTEKFV